MLLTKRKRAQCRLLSSKKGRAHAALASAAPDRALDHDKQLAVVDAVEWAAERWSSPDFAERSATDPRPTHAARLIAALVYLDVRFERLDPRFVSKVIDSVATPPTPEQPGPRLDAKAAAAQLTVEVGAFRR